MAAKHACFGAASKIARAVFILCKTVEFHSKMRQCLVKSKTVLIVVEDHLQTSLKMFWALAVLYRIKTNFKKMNHVSLVGQKFEFYQTKIP